MTSKAEGSRLQIVLVVARADNGVIGRDGGLPWRLPRDLARFKRLTMGCPMVMGRKTFEAIGRPLPGRTSIVVTRDRAYAAAGAEVAHDLGAALARARDVAAASGAKRIAIVASIATLRTSARSMSTTRNMTTGTG